MIITIDKGELKSLVRETLFEILVEKNPQLKEYVAEAVEDILLLSILRNEPEEKGMSFDTFLEAIDDLTQD